MRKVWPMLVIFALTILATWSAHAGTTVTEKPRSYEVHEATGALEKDPTTGKMREWPTNEEDCAARAQALAPKPGSCVIRRNFETVQNCVDEKAPSITLEQKEIDGQKYWEIPTGTLQPAPGETNGWAVMVWAYVHNPSWPLGYPNCWVRGFAPENQWRLNPNYPSTPILELIVPGMVDISEPPNFDEPVCPKENTDPRCPPFV
jgi:hypothetical protein